MKGKSHWVDYKEIKARVSLRDVLGRYGVNLKPAGANHVGCCPIHKGSNPRQFSVSFERNIWNCFGNCKSGGNVLDFVARMENVPLREAGLLLQNWFPAGSGASQNGENETPQKATAPDTKKTDNKLVRKEKRPEAAETGPEPEGEEPRVNPPLKFELKNLTADHPFFEERGILPETVAAFGLGHCTRGLMAGRIAIPIHDYQGKLVAYCGRAVSEEQIEEEGKYKLPANFLKSEVVYNLHRQAPDPEALILVESFLSVWRLYQAGFPATVALMGSSLSERQEELILSHLGPSGRALLFFDGDEDGKKCTEDCLARLSKAIFVKRVNIEPFGRKPHRLDPELLQGLLSA